MAVATNISDTELERMVAVRRYEILDTPQDGAFERITALAARRFGVPISIISIVDEDRIWFKSHHGLPVEQIGREAGLCASAILSHDPHILFDARTDLRALANPLVAGEFGLRFYAAVPLTTHDGYNLGTLCIIDKEPRSFDQSQIDDLKDLAAIVMDQLETQLAARRAIWEAELLAKEIDHRVMNSLQFVSGLLTMQSRLPGASAAAAHLQLAANRVAAVAQVHRHFYAEGANETSCIIFLRRLCADLEAILNRSIMVRGDDGNVPTTSIQPIGLIVNELVTNAAKHGEGTIDVHFEDEGEAYALIVSDDGRNLPPDFDPSAVNKSLGMRVVTSLAKQLKGKLTSGHRPDGGSCFKVAFPNSLG
jgi:two-component sensor histidine kinase